MNNAGAAAAARNGWDYVGGIRDMFINHGYCATDHYVVQLSESVWNQSNKEGSFHPNNLGQDVYARRLDNRIANTLGLMGYVAPPGTRVSGRVPGGVVTGDSFVVTFVAKPHSASRANPAYPATPLFFNGNQGLWSIRVDADLELTGTKARVFHATGPLKILQAGDLIGDRYITDLGTSVATMQDPVAAGNDPTTGRTPQRGDHRIVVWADTCTTNTNPCTAGSGQILLRGTHFDTDQDGLLDHWEKQGIDMNGDGTVDLNLQALGANYQQRDLFLEVDWSNPRPASADLGWSDEPAPGMLASLVQMFALAPAVGSIPAGITVHIDAGAGNDLAGNPFSQGMPAGVNPALLHGGQLIGQKADNTKHLDLVYFGVEGSINVPNLAARSFDDIKTQFFANTEGDARELVFHYAVLADFQDSLGTPVSTAATAADNSSWDLNGDGVNDAFSTITAAGPVALGKSDFVYVTSGTGAGQVRQGTGFHPNANPNQMILRQAWNIVPDATSTFVVVGSSSGKAEVTFYDTPDNAGVPGNDVMVTFGGWGVNAGGWLSNAFIQWRTLAHELGHTLGLRHGGVDHFAFKGGTGGNPPPGPLPGPPPPVPYAGPPYDSIMSYSHQTFVASAVTSFAGAGDAVYDDWGNLQLDFQNSMIHLGNSFGKGFGGADTTPETLFTIADYVALNNAPVDLTAPTATITAPPAGKLVGLGRGFAVTVSVADDQGIGGVTISFDVNGDGTIGPDESVAGESLGGGSYRGTFTGLGGTPAVRDVRVTVVDRSGNVGTATSTIEVTATPPLDLTAPLISSHVTPTPNAAGWSNADVVLTWDVADPDSGVGSTAGCDSTSVTGETSGTTFECHAVNIDGIGASAFVTIRLDRTAPAITADRTAANGAGWNNTDVTVAFTCADALSGVADCAPSVTVTTEGSGQSRSGTAVDQAGNSATVSVAGINIDKTAPTVVPTPSPPANSGGWNTTDVIVSFTCSDPGGSGVVACDGPATLSTDGAGQLVTGTATDAAGNIGSTSQTLNVDRGPPTWHTVATGSDSSGRRYLDIQVEDSTSGLASIAAPTAENVIVAVPVFTAGAPSVVVRITRVDGTLPTNLELDLTDLAGNTSVAAPAFPAAGATVDYFDLNERVPLVEETVTGTVLAGGAPVVGVLVRGYSDNGFSAHGRTDASGAFSIGVTRGSWWFSLDSLSHYRTPTQAHRFKPRFFAFGNWRRS